MRALRTGEVGVSLVDYRAAPPGRLSREDGISAPPQVEIPHWRGVSAESLGSGVLSLIKESAPDLGASTVARD